MKVLILANSRHQYQWFVKKFQLESHRYVRGWMDIGGYWIDTPVIMLEGWEYNRDYSLGMMERIGKRFENIGFISEGELWADEEVPIQYCRQS